MRPFFLGLVLLFLNNLAHADIWGYVDERGTAHFAAEQVDARYTLFFRGEGEFDSRKGVQTPAAALPATSAVPLTGAASRLAALIEELYAVTRKSAMRPDEISYAEDDTGRMSMTFLLRGKYIDVKKLMAELETSDSFFVLEGIAVAADDDDPVHLRDRAG